MNEVELLRALANGFAAAADAMAKPVKEEPVADDPEDAPPGETPAKVKSKQKPGKPEKVNKQTALEPEPDKGKGKSAEKGAKGKAEDDLDALLSELDDADPDDKAGADEPEDE